MSMGGGLPRIPGMSGGGRMPRMRKPRVRDPRTAARSQMSRNPLVRGWRRVKSNRFLRKILPQGSKAPAATTAAADAPAAADPAVPSTALEPAPASAPMSAPVAQAGQGVPAVASAEASTPPSAAHGREPAPHHRPGPDASRRERRDARRAARRAVPRPLPPERATGELWRSLLDVGRAQWGEAFDDRHLDRRFVTYFDRQARVLVTVPRQEGGRRRIVGVVEVEGFLPDGQAFVGADPEEGRLPQRPAFRIRSATLTEPVPVSDDMVLEGSEQPNGRFRLLAGAEAAAAAARPGRSGGVEEEA